MAQIFKDKELEASQQTIRFFESVLRASADGMVITDEAQNIVLVNHAFCQIFDCSWREMIETNLYVWLVRIGRDAPGYWAELEQNVSINKISSGFECQMDSKDEIRYFSVNASLVEQVDDEKNDVIVSIWHDVTDHHELAEHLARNVERLEERTVQLTKANERLNQEFITRVRMQDELLKVEKLESIGILAGGIAHDLNNYLTGSDRVLDQGTGGGEILLHVAPICRKAVGIDHDQDMIDQANRNLTASDQDHVTFICMDSEAMDFADEEFDVVINRPSSFEPKGTSRVIKPRGYFVTQRVGYRNCESVFAGFEWSRSFPEDWSIPLGDQGAQFEENGMRIVGLADYSVTWWIKDVESLLFWLRSVPTPDPFDLEIHWKGINALCDTILDHKGFRTNEHRELLVAQKS